MKWIYDGGVNGELVFVFTFDSDAFDRCDYNF